MGALDRAMAPGPALGEVIRRDSAAFPDPTKCLPMRGLELMHRVGRKIKSPKRANIKNTYPKQYIQISMFAIRLIAA
jgi:hypothetical protein